MYLGGRPAPVHWLVTMFHFLLSSQQPISLEQLLHGNCLQARQTVGYQACATLRGSSDLSARKPCVIDTRQGRAP